MATNAAEPAGLRPWHLLALGVLAAGAAGALMTRGGTTVNTISVIVTILTTGLVAAGAVRTFRPLTSADVNEQSEMLAGRTRAAMEREKALVLRSIKEVEFDRAMRKISDADYQEMVTRLRGRAVGLLRQLDGGGYRNAIERDLAALLGQSVPSAREASGPAPAVAGQCARCSARNDADARFCKACGAQMGGVA